MHKSRQEKWLCLYRSSVSAETPFVCASRSTVTGDHRFFRIASECEAKTDILWVNLCLCANEAASESDTKKFFTAVNPSTFTMVHCTTCLELILQCGDTNTRFWQTLFPIPTTKLIEFEFWRNSVRQYVGFTTM